MSIVRLPADLKRVIDRQVEKGRALTEDEFLAAAIQCYADALEQDEDEIAAAADEGIADIEAGRFELISGPEDICGDSGRSLALVWLNSWNCVKRRTAEWPSASRPSRSRCDPSVQPRRIWA
jgi:hypothetical protein